MYKYPLTNNNKPLQPTTIIPIAIWESQNIPTPVPEYRFSLNRKWRIDYAWPEYQIAMEIEGGIYIGGRHINPKGYIKDQEKYNNLAEIGWQLLRYQPKRINFFQIKSTIENKIRLTKESEYIMNKLTTTEKLLFESRKKDCIKLTIDDHCLYCTINDKTCDYEFCPILKSCYDMEEFIDVLEKKRKYVEKRIQ